MAAYCQIYEILITCALTAHYRDQLWNLNVGIEYGTTFTSCLSVSTCPSGSTISSSGAQEQFWPDALTDAAIISTQISIGM